MYVDEYTDINKALELLIAHGSLTKGDTGYYPSHNEVTAYNTILMHESNKDVANKFFIHQPSKRMLLRPTVGMGVTLHYPSDSYPYEVTKVISEQTLEIREMIATPVPGWKADFTPGGFCGHIHNLREQKFTYTPNPKGRITRIRLNNNGRWMNSTIPYSVGHASYFRDWND